MSTKIESKQTEKKERKKVPVELNLDLDSDESLSQEEAFAKIALILAETKNPKLLTELDEYEIKLCAALFSVCEQLKLNNVGGDEMLTSFLDNFLKLRVSHRRLGRKELLEIARSAQQAPEQRFSRLRNIFGMGSNK